MCDGGGVRPKARLNRQMAVLAGALLLCAAASLDAQTGSTGSSQAGLSQQNTSPMNISLTDISLPTDVSQPIRQSNTPTLPQSGTNQATPLPGSISGTVTDRDGALIAGAQVRWTDSTHGQERSGQEQSGQEQSGQERSAISGSDGRFQLNDVPPGPFELSILAPGEVSAHRLGMLHPGESLDLAQMALQPAGARVDVQVSATREELAEAEIKAEETQRIIGFIPNFYVSYDWKAAPLSVRQKYQLAWKTIVDPATFLLNGVSAGFEQAQNTFPGYGQGAAGYGKRFGANYGGVISGTLLGGAVMPQIFHQDPRYFYKGTGSIRRRLGYALSTTVVCRGDNGKWQPCYSAVLGDLSAGAIANAYYPATDRHGAALTFEQGLLSLGFDGLGNVIQEFVIRHLTPHPPTYPSSQP